MTRVPEVPIAHWRSFDNTEQTLEAHLQGVSELARIFAAKLGLQDAGELIGALHDLGKYSKEFQNYIHDIENYINNKQWKFSSVENPVISGKKIKFS